MKNENWSEKKRKGCYRQAIAQQNTQTLIAHIVDKKSTISSTISDILPCNILTYVCELILEVVHHEFKRFHVTSAFSIIFLEVFQTNLDDPAPHPPILGAFRRWRYDSLDAVHGRDP